MQDTGLGIPAEVQEGIFEPFITAEQPDRRRQGIGLGLSITRRLVALHRGSMALESQPGQGSTFHVYLPLPSLADPVASLSPASTQPVLLLLSAQDQPLAEIVHLSRQLGVPIRCVKTGEDLETVLRATQPVILAWDTAGATPAEWHLMRQLQSHPRLSQAPFILYSQPPANLGPSNLITKPVSPKTLLDMINTLRLPALNGPILIVDDDPPTCEFYQNLVAQALSGYAIRTAHNGATALDIMAKEAPSLVILDLNMPELDGFDVLDWMRANPSTRPVPVLILSGRMLSFEDAQRLAGHALVTFQSKGLLSVEETAAALQRQLFSLEALPPHTSAVVKRAVAYFHHNYHRPLSRPEIAEAVGVSENYLSRIFSQELGLLPWQYLNRYRVMQAKRLLDQTNDSITAIALQVGFNDPAYFSKVFLREANCSPTEYRKRAIASIG
ncbi:MAG: helix-turn-helix domain-containing protein [Anaerolineae bacterium]